MTPHASQQFLAQLLLEPPDLNTDGRRASFNSVLAAATLPVRTTIQ
jgi:hypothetical protein